MFVCFKQALGWPVGFQACPACSVTLREYSQLMQKIPSFQKSIERTLSLNRWPLQQSLTTPVPDMCIIVCVSMSYFQLPSNVNNILVVNLVFAFLYYFCFILQVIILTPPLP